LPRTRTRPTGTPFQSAPASFVLSFRAKHDYPLADDPAQPRNLLLRHRVRHGRVPHPFSRTLRKRVGWFAANENAPNGRNTPKRPCLLHLVIPSDAADEPQAHGRARPAPTSATSRGCREEPPYSSHNTGLEWATGRPLFSEVLVRNRSQGVVWSVVVQPVHPVYKQNENRRTVAQKFIDIPFLESG
jgi:hypothetical protein